MIFELVYLNKSGHREERCGRKLYDIQKVFERRELSKTREKTLSR